MLKVQEPSPGRQRVVIIGAGFSGLDAARALADAPVDVIVIDRFDHHLHHVDGSARV
jgi:NADH:quinone reductase (non-electrogenic)